jgi:hypothetical protein
VASDAEAGDVPEGSAVFPEIPAELGVHPLLLATLHMVVFLQGSEPNVVHPAAADESMEYVAAYLQRLAGPDLRRVREDLATLVGFAREEKWSRGDIAFLKDFLKAFGVGEGT